MAALAKEAKQSFLSHEQVSEIIQNYTGNGEVMVENFTIKKASEKVMGFLGEYWKLQVIASVGSDCKNFNFFVKSISRSNETKAAMVTELKLFDKEAAFYDKIKPCLEIADSKPFSPKLATVLENDIILQDMESLGYKIRDKFEPFDLEHCKRALESLATFHSGSIYHEEQMKKRGRPSYTLLDEFSEFLHEGGYNLNNTWLNQNMTASLEVIRELSKYRNSSDIKIIEEKWYTIWESAFQLSDSMDSCRNVVNHRDLWNNNILYHYDSSGRPDSCVFVDFQGGRYQPPAGDIMLFLYCTNMDSHTLEKELPELLIYYHSYMSKLLEDLGIEVNEVLPLKELMRTAEEQRKWGLVLSCCLLPQFWIDDDKNREMFADVETFTRILTKDKAKFIKQMMNENEKYKEKILDRFEEVVWRYVLN